MTKWLFRTPFGNPKTFKSPNEALAHGAIWGSLCSILIWSIVIIVTGK